MALSFMAAENRYKIKNLFLLSAILSLFFAFIAKAETTNEETPPPPLFEMGVFIGSVSLADYPAADQVRIRTIPAPLVRYHGDLFRADDEDGTRFRFINNKHIDFDLSFGGSFPTDTGNNQARLDMPNLDWLGEIGPRLLYYFYKDKNIAQVRIGLPIRASFGTDLRKWYSVGYVVAPTFQIDKYNFLVNKLDLFFIYTFTHFDEGQADYFYQIDPQYQTTERRPYDAKAGTLGSELSLAVKYQWRKKTIIMASKYSDFSQSANTQGYLHRNSINWSFFVGLGWVLSESDERGIK